MPKNRKRNGLGRVVGPILVMLVGLVLLVAVLLDGNNIALFNTKGMIAREQMNLMVVTVGIMLLVAIPALFLAFFTAWKYRESNARAVHDPDIRHSKFLDLGMWLIPSIFAVVLALIMWPATHKLDPHEAIAADAKPITIQVVSMRWKWLFIYPEQKIATVNYVQIPVNTPVRFELTADEAPMSSFWIPNLGGQLYTMTGHLNQLNLIADTLGDYRGSSAEINGTGFAGMTFTTRVSSSSDFDRWVQSVAVRPNVLDATEYSRLLKPSESDEPAFYSVADTKLYDTVLKKYMGPSNGSMHTGTHH